MELKKRNSGGAKQNGKRVEISCEVARRERGRTDFFSQPQVISSAPFLKKFSTKQEQGRRVLSDWSKQRGHFFVPPTHLLTSSPESAARFPSPDETTVLQIRIKHHKTLPSYLTKMMSHLRSSSREKLRKSSKIENFASSKVTFI